MNSSFPSRNKHHLNKNHQLFAQMPKPESIANTLEPLTPRRSPRLLALKNNSEQERPCSLKRLSCLSLQKKSIQEPLDPKTSKSRSKWVVSSRPSRRSSREGTKKQGKDSSEKVKRSNAGSRNRENPVTGLTNSPTWNEEFDGSRSLRRSLRISNQCTSLALANSDLSKKNTEKSDGWNPRARISTSSKQRIEEVPSVRRSQRLCNPLSFVDEHKDKRSRAEHCVVSSGSANGGEFSDVRKRGVDLKPCKRGVVETEKRTRRVSVCSKAVDGGSRETKVQELDEVDRDREVSFWRKRKRDDEGNLRSHSWTIDQELALQRAYFVEKPTPQFWKKVAKLVPGKSAQECFDKVNSEYATPRHPCPRSRAKIRTDISPLKPFSLSASKLLNTSQPRVKKPGGNKENSRVTHKAIRQLLQTHYYLDQHPEADLFSVLEPNLDESTYAFKPQVEISTPKQLLIENQVLSQRCNWCSSSSHKKKSLSRLSTSFEIALASPPVLKEVKNRVLHEKYIDQLHCREARRKAMSARAEKCSIRSEDGKENHMLKVDIRVAKNALVSDVRDAINKFKHIKAAGTSDSADLDGIVIENCGEEDEDEI